MTWWLHLRRYTTRCWDDVQLFISVLLYYLDIASDIQTLLVLFTFTTLGSATFIFFLGVRIVTETVYQISEYRRGNLGTTWYEWLLALVELRTLWLYHHRHDKGRLAKLYDSTSFELLLESSPMSVLQCILAFMIMEIDPRRGGVELSVFISLVISILTAAFNSTQELERRLRVVQADSKVPTQPTDWNRPIRSIAFFFFFLCDGVMSAASFASLAGSLHLVRRFQDFSGESVTNRPHDTSTLCWFFIMALIYMFIVFMILKITKATRNEKLPWSQLLMQVGRSVYVGWESGYEGRTVRSAGKASELLRQVDGWEQHEREHYICQLFCRVSRCP